MGVCESADEWPYTCEGDAAEERQNREKKARKKETKERRWRSKRKKKKKTGQCVFMWGATKGIVFPSWPLPGPSQKPPGVPGFLRKNISAPITPEPSAGLFTLAWLPDSFTDVTYRHTGTLSQRGSRSPRREEEEEESAIDDKWSSEEDGG